MSTRHYFLTNATGVAVSGVSFVHGESTVFGATFSLVSAVATASVLFETTVDGGATWVGVASFSLDSNGGLSTPPIEITGSVIRASVLSSTGKFTVSCWTE